MIRSGYGDGIYGLAPPFGFATQSHSGAAEHELELSNNRTEQKLGLNRTRASLVLELIKS